MTVFTVIMSMMSSTEQCHRRQPDHDQHQGHDGPGNNEVETKAELPEAASSLVFEKQTVRIACNDDNDDDDVWFVI